MTQIQPVPVPEGFDFTNPDLYQARIPLAEFAELRMNARICWNPQTQETSSFDETVFDEPYTFDITRDPNPYLGFGGGGAHDCIGANLARMEINLIFDAIADQMPDLSPLGPPRRLRSAWLNGIKGLPVRYV